MCTWKGLRLWQILDFGNEFVIFLSSSDVLNVSGYYPNPIVYLIQSQFRSVDIGLKITANTSQNDGTAFVDLGRIDVFS